MRAHFCEKLEGVPCTFQSLIDEDRSSCGEIAVTNKAIALIVDAVPPIQFLTLKHARGKMNGVAEAGIGGELLKLFPILTALMVLPLHVKSAMTIRLPVQWLGGALMELFKGSGARVEIGSYRDITLAALEGKRFGSFIRIDISW